MESLAQDLAKYLIDRLRKKSESSRVLVGISGIPASGKSTFSRDIVHHCNRLLGDNHFSTSAGQPEAILVGLDGWHLSRAQLDKFPDPKNAHDRRGAHWTFDGTAYDEFVAKLCIPIQSLQKDTDSAYHIIKAPSFDHALKDPSPDSVIILPTHRIVVIEGLYTFLSIDPWKNAGEKLDERWFIDVDIDKAKNRLVKRHVLTGVAKDTDEAIWRADNNDMPNGKFVIDNMLPPTRRIASLDDPTYAIGVEHGDST